MRFSLRSRRFKETRPYSDHTSGPALCLAFGTVAGLWRTSDGIFQTEEVQCRRQLLRGVERILHAHQCYRGVPRTATDNAVSTRTLLYGRFDAKIDKPGPMVWRNRTLRLEGLGAGPGGVARTWPDPAVTASRWFEDVTDAAGIHSRHTNRAFENPYARIMAGYTALGAAAAVADYDGDGFDDIFVTDSSENGKNHLYHNNGDLTFTDVADRAGVANGNDAANATADAVWLDYDNDGRPDLFVVRFGRSQLFHNDGHGRFADVTKRAGLDRYANAITAIAFDYDRDGNVDLFVGSYFSPVNVFDPKTPRFFPESFETANNGGGITAYRNRGDGTFEDVTERIGLGG